MSLLSLRSVISRTLPTLPKTIFTTSSVFFSKSPKQTVGQVGQENEQLIMLKDEKGKILGLRPMEEAERLAKKSHFFLTELKQELSKHRIFQLTSFGKHVIEDTEMDSDPEGTVSETDGQKQKGDAKRTKRVIEIKRVAISTRSDQHDVLTKIKQIRKWIEKDMETRVMISGASDKKALDKIYKQIEEEFKGKARINQKKIAKDSCKFNILPLGKKDSSETSDQTGTATKTDIDFDNLDPNELLKDDFEKILEKK